MKVKNLEGLRRTVALGSLNLANNDLVWSDLSKIQHMHILNLNLHGNRKLEKNTYCEFLVQSYVLHKSQ